ncbi:MAG: hypothetical protein JWO12_1975, partial [Frankiales bacterium]|nr:hypothetical protein [Frankiales bacterium]
MQTTSRRELWLYSRGDHGLPRVKLVRMDSETPPVARRLLGRRTPARVPLLAVATILIAAAACGTTVPRTAQVDAGQNVGQDLGSTATTTGGDQASGSSSLPGGTSSSQTSSGGSSNPGTPAGVGSSSSGPVQSGSLGSGPSAKGSAAAAKAPLLVGIPYVDQSQSSTFTGAIGAGLATADDKAIYTLLIKNLNARGGVNGHKVVAVFHRVDPTQNSADYSAAACADFTQDHHVSVVFIAFSLDLDRCVIKAGAAVIGNDPSGVNRADYAQLKYVLQPDAIALDQLAELQASEFTAMGLFSSPTPAKVGILYFDEPHYIAAEKVLEAGLAKRGVKVVDREAFHYVASTQDVGQTESQINSAVLRFQADGVTQVLGVETNAWLIGFFGVHAASQSYYPRYGFTSDEVLTNVQSNVPAKELKNSLFIGWTPAYDTADVSVYPNAAKSCLTVMKNNGMDMSTGNERSSALTDCDNLNYLATALTAGGEPLSRDRLLAGAKALGTSFAPADTYIVHQPNG